MGRRLKSYILVMVSMVMLTALVIPHHHHGDKLCMRHYVETHHEKHNHCSDELPPDESHDESCTTGCVTHMVLNKVDCSRDLSDGDILFTVVYAVFDYLSEWPLSGHRMVEAFFYTEKLCPQYLVKACGLRAPPVMNFLG